MHLDRSIPSVAFLSSVSLPCEKSLVLWGGVIAQGQQRTKTPWCATLSRVICVLSPMTMRQFCAIGTS
eukprot:scaffold172050_cov73-Attheya_sp.AAC.2